MDDASELINAGGIEVIIEAPGNLEAGIDRALKSFNRGRHVVIVNVEADALAGPCWPATLPKPMWFILWLTGTNLP